MLFQHHPGHRPLLVIVGPTGIGKTSLSLELALMFSGEIISADSRLFYKGMDIGTDKPSLWDRAQVRHHLVDICKPDEIMTLGQYTRAAAAAIDDVQSRNQLPILTGGTGQYVRAVVEGWQVPEVAPQIALREALEKMGGPELSRWLTILDPKSASAIDPLNVRRVIRALEVTLVSGYPISHLQGKKPPQFDIMTIGLNCDREILYSRIDTRVDRMIANGLVEEVRNLRAIEYGRDLPAMSGLGYRQVYAYLDGEMDLDDCVERIKFETHRLARQQHNWFRQDDHRINWYDTGQSNWRSRVIQDVRHYLASASLK